MTDHPVLVLQCLLAASLFIVYYTAVDRRLLYPTALNLFFLYQGLGLIGSIVKAEPDAFSVDHLRAWTTLTGLTAVMAGGWAVNTVGRFDPLRETNAFRRRPVTDDVGGLRLWLVLVPIVVAGVLVGVLYIRAMGYNVPVELVRAFARAGDVSASAEIYGQMRTGVWSDDSRYIAPGYAAQFIKVLLPWAFFVTYLRSQGRVGMMPKFLSLGLFVPTFFLLVAPGVRAYVILFGAVFVVLALPGLGPLANRPKSGRTLAYAGVGVVAATFGLLTFLGGRTRGANSIGEGVVGVAMDFLDRTAFVTSEIQLVVMRVMAREPHSLGRGWTDSLAVLLPGSRRGRSNEIYEMVYGGNGNAPLDLWTSLWLEFGWFGCIAVPFLIGVFLQWLHVRLVRRPKRLTSLVALTMLSFMMFDIAEPISWFNNGAVTIALLLGLLSLTGRLDDLLRRLVARPDRRGAAACRVG